MRKESTVEYTLLPVDQSDLFLRRVKITTTFPDNSIHEQTVSLPNKEAQLLCSIMCDNKIGPSVNPNGWHNKKSFLIEIARRLWNPFYWMEKGGKYLVIRFDSRTGHANIQNAEDVEEKERSVRAVDNVAVVATIRRAIEDYYFSLDTRQHGAVAANRCLSRIESTLDMRWIQGETKARRES